MPTVTLSPALLIGLNKAHNILYLYAAQFLIIFILRVKKQHSFPLLGAIHLLIYGLFYSAVSMPDYVPNNRTTG
jgi:hypothetical protein